MKPPFKFVLRQKPAICVSIMAGFISCLNCKIRYSKLLCTLKTRFFDEFQGKKASNPDGLRVFLTQKGVKNMFLRQCCLIEEWLCSRPLHISGIYTLYLTEYNNHKLRHQHNRQKCDRICRRVCRGNVLRFCNVDKRAEGRGACHTACD